MPPRVGSTGVIAYISNREGIVSVGIILATSVHLKTCHISRKIGSTWVTIFGTGTSVAGAGVVEKNLQILIGIVILLGIETQCHTQLGIQEAKIGLRAAGAIFVSVYTFVAIRTIAFVIGRVLAGLNSHILGVEHTAAGHASTPRLAALCVG